MAKVIVVGGGLAGLSAAHTALERGDNVLILDKNPFLGGNSTKATSGINGALTNSQKALGIKDSAESFYDDTARSARDLIRPGLVKVLTYNSSSAVEWLQSAFGLDLSLVSQLGGHSFPRTHRGKEKFPGMTITYALMEKLEDIVKAQPNRAQMIKKAKVNHLIFENDAVVGVEYEHNGQNYKEYGVVIIATGGYAADFTQNGLINKYRPDVFNLPTTNGDWSTGDGIKMINELGGSTIDLEKIQVHPTGLVDPNEPDAKLKFLAAEALRGVGGILLDKNGNRFCDELGHRDYVTGEMNKNKGPFRLVLNGAAAKEILWHCKHYMGRNLMKHFAKGSDLAKEIGISNAQLEDTFNKYNDVAKTKKDPYGKKFFHNMPLNLNDEFYVAIVTPVVHYCMGGVEINPESKVMYSGGQKPITGLFACGEVGGGVHGANRLGGSSLLGCVVYGRVAGNSASDYLKSIGGATKNVGNTNANNNSNGFNVQVSPNENKITITWGNANQVGSKPTASSTSNESATTTATTTESSSSKLREITAEEVAKHKTENDCWCIVNGKVLDVTKFLPDHPGGKKAILIYAGRDATEEFNMLHKPDVVDKYAPECVIGVLKGPAHLPKSKL